MKVNTNMGPLHTMLFTKLITISYGTIIIFIIIGASACMKLNRFEEAITWCDKGLAVSFTHGLFLDFFLFALSVIIVRGHHPY